MLDRQNQGPQCTACGTPMKLTAIEPSDTGHDLRTFTCPHCERVQRHIIESAVTEAWIDRQRAANVRQGSVSYQVRDGRMTPKIPKSPK